MKTLTRFFHFTATLMIFFFPLFAYAGGPAVVVNSSTGSSTGQVASKAPLFSSKHDSKQTFHKKDKNQNKNKLHRREPQIRCRPSDFQSHPVFDAQGQLIRHEYLDSKGMLRILIIFKKECGCWHETRFDENGRIISEGEYTSMPVYEEKSDSYSEEVSDSDQENSHSENGSSSSAAGSAAPEGNNGGFNASGVQTADKLTQYQYGGKGTLVKIIVKYPAKHMQCEYNGKGVLQILIIYTPGKRLIDKYDFHNGKPVHHTCLNHKGEILDHGPKPGHGLLIHRIPVRITVNINLIVHSGTRPSMKVDDMTPRSTAASPAQAQESKQYTYDNRRPIGKFSHERVEDRRYTQGRVDKREDVRDRWERGERTEIYTRSASSVKLNDPLLSWKEKLQSRFSSEISDFQSMKEVFAKGDLNGKKPFKDAVTQGNPEKNDKAYTLKEQAKKEKVTNPSEKTFLKSRSPKEKGERPLIGPDKASSGPGILPHKTGALKEKEQRIQHKTDIAPVKLSLPSAKMHMKK